MFQNDQIMLISFVVSEKEIFAVCGLFNVFPIYDSTGATNRVLMIDEPLTIDSGVEDVQALYQG